MRKGGCLLETHKERLEKEGLIPVVLLLCARCISHTHDHFTVNENKCEQKNGCSLQDLAAEQGLLPTARADKPNSCSRELASREAVPLISPRKSNTTRGRKMRHDISLQRHQPIQKQIILGYFLHAHRTEAHLHTPVPWLATKLHCRQIKFVNHKETKKK